MHVRLLGPMNIENGDGQVRLTAPMHRLLVAVLALHPGDVIPTDVLADALWDSKPPRSWQATIRNYIRRVRAALGPSANLLRTQHPGYLLDIGRGDIDVLRFSDLVKEGQATIRDRDWQRASGILTQALALCYGTPLADIPASRLRDDQAAHLEQARITALSARIDADLRLCPSRAHEVIPELGKLSSDRPGDERLRGQLMAALCLAGRAGEAHAVYQEGWRFARDEFGSEPGPRLRRVHQRILDHDDDLLDEI
jgi:DNA-binding SARP family transcriptional activator